MKKLIFPYVWIIIIILFLMWIGGRVFATQNSVTICHAIGSQNNPYQKLTVDDDAVNGFGNGDHNSSQHQNGNDIIPPGYWDSNGRNWTQQNQAIWNNNCNIPQPTSTPIPTATNTPSPTLTSTPNPTVTPTTIPTISPTSTPTPIEDPCKGECEEELTPTPTVMPSPSILPTNVPLTENKVYSQEPTPDGSKSKPTCDVIIPDKPVFVSFDRGVINDHKLILLWPHILNATHVNIYYGEYGRPLEHGVANIPDTGNYEVKELKNRTNYNFCVQGINRCAVGPMLCVDPMP